MNKKSASFILITILLVFAAILTACKSEKNNKEIVTDETLNPGSITFADVKEEDLEKYYDDIYSVFIFEVTATTDVSRTEIYEKLLEGKFDKDKYLGSGLIIGTAKEMLDLKPAQGLDIVLREYVYENYTVTEEYVKKFEAEKDTVKLYVNYIEQESDSELTDEELEKIRNENERRKQNIIDNYDVVYISNDGFYPDNYGIYIELNVNKEELEALYKDENVKGMRKQLWVEPQNQRRVINTYIDNFPIIWPEK